VTATLRRRWPPSLWGEDIWAVMRPFLSGPTATEKMMTSRSLPCTFSMFLTRMGSCVWLRSKLASSDGGAAAGLVLDQALLVAVERDDADRLRCGRTARRRFTGAGFCHFRSPLVRPQRVTSGQSSLLM
jgi:hypothetical protein